MKTTFMYVEWKIGNFYLLKGKDLGDLNKISAFHMDLMVASTVRILS